MLSLVQLNFNGVGADVKETLSAGKMSEMDEQNDESFMHFIKGGAGLQSFSSSIFFNG